MAHPQNSYRGDFAKERVEVGGSGTNAVLTSDSTGNLRLSVGLSLSGETTDVLTQNSTALVLPSALDFPTLTAAPATRYGPGHLVFVSNSTGTMFAMNTTGTTWTYLNVTSILA